MFLQILFNLFFDGFGFLGILAISPGDVALFSAVIIGCPRDLLGLIPGFPGKGGFRYFIIFFRNNGVPWSYSLMVY